MNKSPERGRTNKDCFFLLRPNNWCIGAIRLYQILISPLLPRCCRFEPSCSHYAIEAYKVHGFFKGTLLTGWRLLRCQPFCRGGFDPVPPKNSRKKTDRNKLLEGSH